jgi:hypothetical protein
MAQVRNAVPAHPYLRVVAAAALQGREATAGRAEAV